MLNSQKIFTININDTVIYTDRIYYIKINIKLQIILFFYNYQIIIINKSHTPTYLPINYLEYHPGYQDTTPRYKINIKQANKFMYSL